MTCSTRIWAQIAIRASKAFKIANNTDFWTHFAIFRCLIGPLVAIWAQILVEHVISFEMSTETSKLDKNCFQEWVKSDSTT